MEGVELHGYEDVQEPGDFHVGDVPSWCMVAGLHLVVVGEDACLCFIDYRVGDIGGGVAVVDEGQPMVTLGAEGLIVTTAQVACQLLDIIGSDV